MGVDVGSVSTNLVLFRGDRLFRRVYLRTMGQPIRAIKQGLFELDARGQEVSAVGVTGSGRRLAAVLLGADIVKNEITAHAVASMRLVPGVQTILEIGGQDSKLILVRDGIVSDFSMNTVCAAGTGSFLDQQAARLGIPIGEFGSRALTAKSPVRIAGRCAVFAESDMIHKQQMGHRLEDILAGLCEALVRNYMNNLSKGRDLKPIVSFQGGVAANQGMRRAFEDALNQPVVVPEYYDVMGALGAALLAKEWRERTDSRVPSGFHGWGALEADISAGSFECTGCPNMCEVVDVRKNGRSIARWGDRCGKWQHSDEKAVAVR